MGRDTTRIQNLTRVSTLAEGDILPTGPVSGDRAKGITLKNLRSALAFNPDAPGSSVNVAFINELSDFPDPVNGLIELVQPGVPNITYIIGALNIDVSPNVFSVRDGSVVIRGVHRTASGLTTTSESAMFTCERANFFQEFISINCNGQWMDFTNDTDDLASFVAQNVVVINCGSLGTIDGSFVTSLRTFTVVATQTNGFLWTGSANSQINTTNLLAISWTGTLFDLGTATFDLIRMGQGDRYISPAGTTILSGAPASANFTATGRGLVSGAIFNGTGTAINGINTSDVKWKFEDNIFADNTTKNTRNIADSFLTALETVTNGGIGVYVPIGGTNWDSDFDERFTVSTAGVMTYIGLGAIDIVVSAVLSVEKSGGGSDKICSKIAIGGVVQDKTIGCTENNTPTGISSVGVFSITNGMTVEVMVANLGSTGDIDVSEANIHVTGG